MIETPELAASGYYVYTLMTSIGAFVLQFKDPLSDLLTGEGGGSVVVKEGAGQGLVRGS